MELSRFARFLYQPSLPMGKNGKRITGSAPIRAVARKAATEGTVLLKNDGTLPLKKGEKVCLFGTGAAFFQFGGGGSGRVFTDHSVSLGDGLKKAASEGKIQYFQPLTDFYEQAKEEEISEARKIHPTEQDLFAWEKSFKPCPPAVPSDLYSQAVAFGGTAIFCLSRFSSEGDVNGDRVAEKGDFYLWDEEEKLLADLCRDFKKVVVILNTCGPVSTVEYAFNPKVNAILYPLFGGESAGESLTEILLGEAYPSGHLQHTLAKSSSDYPGTDDLHKSPKYVEYTEDIFVGYRYFETFCPEKVVYPFGFGLSYTDFTIKTLSAKRNGMKISLRVSVKNTGSFLGKEVVQAYLSAPNGILGKAKKVLCAFEKTRELKPGEETVLTLSFSLKDFASYDDLGKIWNQTFLLEKGNYEVFVGNSVRDSKSVFSFELSRNVKVKECMDYMAPIDLKERLTAFGTMERLPRGKRKSVPPVIHPLTASAPEENLFLDEALEQGRLEEFLASLSDAELGEFLHGHETANPSSTNAIGHSIKYISSDTKRIPAIPTSDGPMGLRMRKGRGVCATYFPCSNTVSQTWNRSLIQKVGKSIALEAKENNVGFLLAPGLNIQRSPLCGRNFEYYSEDPFTSGEIAVAYVIGVQSQKISATIKHFCCNNREFNRKEADSRVSQRALREIYLRGFEIAIQKADPWALMTSYNLVNTRQSTTSSEALNGILRGEWGYEGVVMTDWRSYSLLEDEVNAGGDVKMPQKVSTNYDKAPADIDLGKMIAKGIIPRDVAITSARRVLTLMSHLD